MIKATRCNFKNTSPEAYETFKHSRCLLLVSVGQGAHEGECFEATVNLINNSFQSCIVSLYDSLQRYTMALNSEYHPRFFHAAAAREGDLWLERNERYLKKLTILEDISRWDTWLHHPRFQEQEARLRALIFQDTDYRAAFEKTIDKYLERYCNNRQNLSYFERERAWELCFEYVLEECVVLCLWPELACQFEIYPSNHNDAIEATRRRFILPQHPYLLNALTLRFRNTPQFVPQSFISLRELDYEPELQEVFA